MYFFADHPDEPHQEYVGQVCRVLSSSLSLSLSQLHHFNVRIWLISFDSIDVCERARERECQTNNI